MITEKFEAGLPLNSGTKHRAKFGNHGFLDFGDNTYKALKAMGSEN